MINKLIINTIAAAVLTTNLAAKTVQKNSQIDEIHQYYVTKTVDIDLTNSKREFVYFGGYGELRNKYLQMEQDLKKSQNSKVADSAANGALTGLKSGADAIAKGFYKSAGKHLGAGVGIGIIYGLLDPIIMSAKVRQNNQILIYDFTNEAGEKTRVNAYFIAEDFDDSKVIREYLEQKIREEI